MRILVTGGAGFIGSAVVRYLMQQTDAQVLVVDKLTYAGHLSSIQSWLSSPRCQFSQSDITQADVMQALFSQFQPTAVLHLAAESHVDRSIDTPLHFVQGNVVGTAVLLEATRHYWQQLAPAQQQDFRFLHVSTDEVFGCVAHSSESSREDAMYAPRSPYAATKASSDHLVRAWHHTYGLPVLLTHCANNYGPYQFPEKLIPLMILNALHGRALPIYGNGLQVRDWLHVDDHAQALVHVLRHGRCGESYNISACEPQTNLAIVRAICTLLEELAPNKPAGVQSYQELIRFVVDRPGHDLRYAIDASKMNRELAWQAQHRFAEGLRTTVLWYLQNPQWWQCWFQQGDALMRRGIASQQSSP